ncbi:hypothetical protein [Hahella chejuensis]|nr:hypothetical protein [Hahella chejuensis]
MKKSFLVVFLFLSSPGIIHAEIEEKRKMGEMVEGSVDDSGNIFVEGNPSGLNINEAPPRKEPRTHHFKFGKLMLPLVALSQPEMFLRTFTDDRAEGALRNFWNNVGAELPKDEQMRPEGLSLSNKIIDGLDYIIISFPVPEAPNELFFTVIVGDKNNPDTLRVFGLENALKNEAYKYGTILVEWDKKGRYTYKAQLEVSEEQLIDTVGEVLKKKIEVRTFTDMRPYGWFSG